MEHQNARLSPVGVVKEALGLWGRNILAASAFYGVNVLVARLMQKVKPAVAAGCRGIEVNGALVFGGTFFVFLVLNAFLCLSILQIFRGGGPRSWAQAVRSGIKALPAYLKTLFALWGFVIAVSGLAYLFLVGGNVFFAGPAPPGLKVMVLVATSTAFVVLLIAGVWYGFFFSLAPIAAALEGKGVIEALKTSRRLVRGNAVRYATVFLLIGLIYAFLSGLGYFGALRLAGSKGALGLIEAFAGVLVGPVWLAAWLVSYQRLTAMKQIP